jgi:S-adenosylmethionine:tRNA ribosyltransferase-isomerase
MKAARTYPARRDDVRLLVMDAGSGELREARSGALPALLEPDDLIVVNDAATLPASLHGHDGGGHAVEARLIAGDAERGEGCFWAVLLGAGDWRQRTEDRPDPFPVLLGDWLSFRGDDGREALAVQVIAVSPLSPRLVCLRFALEGAALWAALYRYARPVQYAYLEHALPLWAVQTVYGARPWAFEMPSAGRPLSWEILMGLRRRGVGWAAITHAAGLSATGDAALDAALPLPERFDIPGSTVRAIAEAHRRGGRVIAVGTTVVRAIEGSAGQAGGALRAGAGITDLRIGHGYVPRIVDGILSGTHGNGESHFSVLAAFSRPDLLAAAVAYAELHDFTTHEFGDAMLVLPSRVRTSERPTARAGMTPCPGDACVT